jgi:hypothetical protein
MERWSKQRPGRFNSWKETRYALYRKLGRPEGRVIFAYTLSVKLLKFICPVSRFENCAFPTEGRGFESWCAHWDFLLT